MHDDILNYKKVGYLLMRKIFKINAPNSISAGAPPQTLLGELTPLHQTPIAGFKGPYF